MILNLFLLLLFTPKQNQLRASKRAEVLQKKRQFSHGSGPPQLVVVLPLSPRVNLAEIWSVLCGACERDCPPVSVDVGGAVTLVNASLKSRYTVVLPPAGDFYKMLDLAKVRKGGMA